MASIKAISTSLPPRAFDNQSIAEAGAQWLHDRPQEHALFQRFIEASHTENRHFVCSLDEILSLNGAQGRAKIFEKEAPRLALPSVLNALKASGLDSSELDTFLFTSCSCPTIPSVDGIVVAEAGLNAQIARIPIYQHGCAGGIVGLSLANKFAKAGSNVLLTSVELCSLVFQPGNLSGGHLVGAAIFGDGAASVVVSPENKGLTFVDSCSTLLPQSRHMMGYDLLDDGSHLRLDRELPSFLAQHVPGLVKDFLRRNNLTSAEVPWWLFHPGGVKILNFLEDAFDLEGERACWARRVLSKFGNLSSASVLFVLSEFMQAQVSKPGDYVLMVGVGPGLTIEQILFEVR